MSVPRGIKTTLTFGLVSCPVQLYKSSGTSKDPAWEVAGPGGGALRKASEPAAATVSDSPLGDGTEAVVQSQRPEEFVEEDTGVLVAAEDVRRGVRLEDGSFVDLEDQIEEIDRATKLEEMRIVGFVRAEQIERHRVLGSYYLAPDGEGAPTVVRLLFEALRAQKRVGVARLTKRSAQTLVALVPHPLTVTQTAASLRASARVDRRPS